MIVSNNYENKNTMTTIRRIVVIIMIMKYPILTTQEREEGPARPRPSNPHQLEHLAPCCRAAPTAHAATGWREQAFDRDANDELSHHLYLKTRMALLLCPSEGSNVDP